MPDDLRSRSMRILLNQVASVQHPSVSMLARIEAAVPDPETAHEYVSLLLDKLDQDAYPSLTMLDRALGLAAALEHQAPLEE